MNDAVPELGENLAPTVSLLQKVPRELSWEVWVLVLLNQVTQAGWFALFLASLAGWVFLPMADLTSPFLPDEDCLVVRGELIRTAATGLREGGHRHRKGDPIMAFHFRYDVDGTPYEGVSYARVSQEGNVSPLPGPGSELTVLVDPDEHGVARIRGLRHAPGPPITVNLPLGLAIMAAGCLLVGLILGLRSAEVLRDHYLGRSVLRANETVLVYGRVRTRLEFEYRTHDGRTLHHETVTDRPEALLDELRERLLYDPQRPEKATLVDAIAPGLVLGENGEVGVTNPRRSWVRLAGPLFVVAANLFIALFL